MKISKLDYANQNALKVANNIGLSLIDKMSENKKKLLYLIAEADIVLIHWWNHPLLYDFLVRNHLPSSRVIIWSHIAGYHPPNVFTEKILTYPDLFVFTTPMSYKSKDVQNLSEEKKKNCVLYGLLVVWKNIIQYNLKIILDLLLDILAL